MEIHELYMRRCFQLAARGAGRVSPNPMVGAVLAHQNRIIGESWHKAWGSPHAEINALASVDPADHRLIPDSILYCNLEPCFHFGKTPPCVDRILLENIRHVVIANRDPNPKVAGQSIRKMKESGILVTEDVLAAEGAKLNRIFFHWINTRQPYIVLKWAQSADGFIGRPNTRTPISNSLTQRLVHRWRTELGAVLVGTKTALVDNPRLDNRFFAGPAPLRIAIDLKGQIPNDHHLLDDSAPTLIAGPERQGDRNQTRFLPWNPEHGPDELLQAVAEAGKTSVLVEGGAVTHRYFLEKGLFHEIRVITNNRPLGNGIPAPEIPAGLAKQETFQLGDDTVTRYFNPPS